MRGKSIVSILSVFPATCQHSEECICITTKTSKQMDVPNRTEDTYYVNKIKVNFDKSIFRSLWSFHSSTTVRQHVSSKSDTWSHWTFYGVKWEILFRLNGRRALFTIGSESMTRRPAVIGFNGDRTIKKCAWQTAMLLANVFVFYNWKSC